MLDNKFQMIFCVYFVIAMTSCEVLKKKSNSQIVNDSDSLVVDTVYTGGVTNLFERSKQEIEMDIRRKFTSNKVNRSDYLHKMIRLVVTCDTLSCKVDSFYIDFDNTDLRIGTLVKDYFSKSYGVLSCYDHSYRKHIKEYLISVHDYGDGLKVEYDYLYNPRR